MKKFIRPRYQGSALIAAGLILICHAFTSHAVDSAAAAGCGSPEYHQLDFWIGEWDTFESDAVTGSSIARTRVQPIVEGCAIHELYEQVDGLIGDSILSYDPVQKHWQQTWVTNRGSLMVLKGNFVNGVLTLEGDAHLQDGRSVMQRISWNQQGTGVREWAEMSTDNGTTWTPAFDVLFVRHQIKR
jgi:hypothetical protein